MTEPEPALSDDQRRVLQTIYGKFRELGRWPAFSEIDRLLRRAGLDPLEILRTMPEALLWGYRPGRPQPMPQDKIGIRVQGIVLCDGGAEDVNRFLRLLRWFAEKELNFDTPADNPDAAPQVTSAEIGAYLQLPDGDDGALDRLYEILNTEHWGQRSSGRGQDGSWMVAIGRDVSRFTKVETVDDYLAARARWEEEGKQLYLPVSDDFYGTVTGIAEVAEMPPPQTDTYVSATMIEALQAAATQSRWNCDKLLQLIDELNDNHASGNAYSAHAMLRAILDHIPPVFGYDDFKQVANNYSWSRTDSKYMKKLLDFKLQGDDVLHRQISTSADLLSIEDMPPRAWINKLLQECADKL